MTCPNCEPLREALEAVYEAFRDSGLDASWTVADELARAALSAPAKEPEKCRGCGQTPCRDTSPGEKDPDYGLDAPAKEPEKCPPCGRTEAAHVDGVFCCIMADCEGSDGKIPPQPRQS